MRLILHIGAEKTGTKTLQSWFAENRDNLLQQGVRYPTSLGRQAHRDLALYAMDPDQPDDGFVREGIHSAEDHKAFCDRTLNAFAQECQAFAAIPSWVISCEHLHSRLATQEMVKRVRRFLGDRFESINVVLHLRPQIDVAVSLASTGARFGARINAAWFVPDPTKEHYYNYDLSVGWWENAFGPDAVSIIPFKRRPSLLDLLIDDLALDTTRSTPPERVNEALDWRSIALANALALRNASRDLDEIFIDDWPAQERLSIGLETAQQFQAVYELGNAALISRRKELILGDLTPDWKAYEAAPNLQDLESVDRFGEQLDYIVVRFQAELLVERCGKRLVECELALATGNTDRALIHLKRANEFCDMLPDMKATADRKQLLRQWINDVSNSIAKVLAKKNEN